MSGSPPKQVRMLLLTAPCVRCAHRTSSTHSGFGVAHSGSGAPIPRVSADCRYTHVPGSEDAQASQESANHWPTSARNCSSDGSEPPAETVQCEKCVVVARRVRRSEVRVVWIGFHTPSDSSYQANVAVTSPGSASWKVNSSVAPPSGRGPSLSSEVGRRATNDPGISSSALSAGTSRSDGVAATRTPGADARTKVSGAGGNRTTRMTAATATATTAAAARARMRTRRDRRTPGRPGAES